MALGGSWPDLGVRLFLLPPTFLPCPDLTFGILPTRILSPASRGSQCPPGGPLWLPDSLPPLGD